MSHRKKVNAGQTECASVQYQNRLAQLVSLVGARKTYCELGRGSAKTTDIQVERLIDLMFDMPGAPCCWVADTFSNLTANVLPSVLEGLERKGFREGIHYVIEKEPPQFSDVEKDSLPEWLKPHFWHPFNKLVSYKRTLIFYTGLNIRFGSLDRPSTLAGASYVFVFGDEAKYFREDKIANLLKAVRGYRQEYGHSPFYRGVCFTSDMADTSHIGEYDWMGKEAGNVNKSAILMIIKAGLVYNDALHEYVAAKDQWLRTHSADDLLDCKSKKKLADQWKARWTELRCRPEASTLYVRASSYVNADILTEGWFADAIDAQLPDLNAAILSIKPRLGSGDRFYTTLSARHFYYDGVDEDAYEEFSLRDTEDCRVLKKLNRDKPLQAGVDFGNMCSMTVGQDDWENGHEVIRIVKFLYTLAPEYTEDLGVKFRNYFSEMRNRVLFLYYDRSGNAYKSVGEDQVSKFKRAVEFDGERRTGWTVHLMSIKQGNIGQPEEYSFMQEILSERNPRLPWVRIDAYAAKNLKMSLELARTKVKSGVVFKDKSSERLPVAELPTKSTNPSDSFKYLLMTRERRKLAQMPATGAGANLDPIFK